MKTFSLAILTLVTSAQETSFSRGFSKDKFALFEDTGIDVEELIGNDVSPPNQLQLLNILSSKMDGVLNESGRLDTSMIYQRQ